MANDRSEIGEYNKTHTKLTKENEAYESLFALWVSKKYFNVPGKICDVGSGNGSSAIAFKKLGYNVLALDSDDFYSKRLINAGVEFKKVDLDSGKLPLKSEEADYFFMKSVIEHLEKPLPFLKEVNRCLKEKGKIFILTPDWERGYKGFYGDPTHKSPFTKISIAAALNMTGFKVLKIRNFKGIPYLWRYFGIKVFDFVWLGSTNMMIIAEKYSSEEN